MMGLKIFMVAAGLLAASSGMAFADGLLTGWSNADGSGIETEFGVRTWLGSGNGGKSLFSPNGASLNSRLTYSSMPIASGEIFGEASSGGFFVSGFAALGTIPGGKLTDEDFPPTATVYSNTDSDQHSGGLRYATVDIGHNFVDNGSVRAGAFIGYNYLDEDFKAFGCTQTAGGTSCVPTVDAATDLIDQSNTWQALRIGISGRADFDNRLSLSGDAAILPFVSLSGADTHHLRPDLLAPVPEDGKGWGAQLQAMLDYRVNDQLSVGIGGRYWHMQTHGSAHFEAAAADGVPQPLDWQTNVFGLLTAVKARF